ncbi:MAG: hypothetical protein JNL83_26480 [Myxococcales bacterium]|nr:hypothetical protein [Myxococcales bacterium]
MRTDESRLSTRATVILQRVRDRLGHLAIVERDASRPLPGTLRLAVPLLGMCLETQDAGIAARFERVSAPQSAEPPWALVLDEELRRALHDLGFDVTPLRRVWLDDISDETLVDSVLACIDQLLRTPVQVVRGTDLPVGMQWPLGVDAFGDDSIGADASDGPTMNWWRGVGRASIGRKPIAELRGVELSPAAAVERGLPPVRIEVNAASAGLVARPFPDQDVFLILNGPPGAPLNIFIWSREQQGVELGTAIREMLVPGWMKVFDLVGPDAVDAIGELRPGVLFSTGAGPTRTAWFAFSIEVQARRVIVMLGVDGRGGPGSTATRPRHAAPGLSAEYTGSIRAK